jgi:hypothetical protein
VPPWSTFSLFSTSLAVGITVMLPLVPRSFVGRRFFVLLSLIAVALISLAVFDRGLDLEYGFFAAAGLLVAYNVLLPPEPRVDPGTHGKTQSGRGMRFALGALVALALLAGLVGLVFDAVAFAERADRERMPAWTVVAVTLSSTALLGSALVSMTLGHWYLVLRGHSFGPLVRVTRALTMALVVRTLVSGVVFAYQWPVWNGLVETSGWTGLFLSDGVFVLARWLFGILAPLVLIGLVWGCLRVESNQSATGILYVIVAFVFLGELLAKHYQLSGLLL